MEFCMNPCNTVGKLQRYSRTCIKPQCIENFLKTERALRAYLRPTPKRLQNKEIIWLTADKFLSNGHWAVPDTERNRLLIEPKEIKDKDVFVLKLAYDYLKHTDKLRIIKNTSFNTVHILRSLDPVVEVAEIDKTYFNMYYMKLILLQEPDALILTGEKSPAIAVKIVNNERRIVGAIMPIVHITQDMILYTLNYEIKSM